jgi:hypothetical protein
MKFRCDILASQLVCHVMNVDLGDPVCLLAGARLQRRTSPCILLWSHRTTHSIFRTVPLFQSARSEPSGGEGAIKSKRTEPSKRRGDSAINTGL